MLFVEELLGGELDGVCPTASRIWGASKFERGETMPDSEGNFGGDDFGGGGNYASTDDTVVVIGEKFNEAVAKRIGFASGEVGKLDGGFFVFTVAAEQVIFVVANSGDFGV